MCEQNSRFSIQPPWNEYPDNEPSWAGWRQGESEAWLQEVWFPFWKQLTSEEQSAYLLQFPPPSEEWSLYLTQFWK